MRGGGATFIPGGTFIPESRVCKLSRFSPLGFDIYLVKYTKYTDRIIFAITRQSMKIKLLTSTNRPVGARVSRQPDFGR